MKTKSTIYESNKTIITSDGELVREELTTIKKVTKEEFLQVYLDDFMSLMKIKEGTEYKLILWIGKNMNHDTNEIALVKVIKERIANDIGTSLKTINNSIQSLARKEILLSQGNALYVLNPKLFFKGSLDNRNNLIKKFIRKIEYQIIENEFEKNKILKTLPEA